MLTIVYADTGDWVGIYDDNGDLLVEGHSINIWTLLNCLGFGVETLYDMPIDGRCPERLEDLP